MSGEVAVLHEAGDPGCYVVACFKTECPEHGDGRSEAPWVSEWAELAHAAIAAREHRKFIKDYWLPDHCPTCGQRQPTTPATDPTQGASDE